MWRYSLCTVVLACGALSLDATTGFDCHLFCMHSATTSACASARNSLLRFSEATRSGSSSDDPCASAAGSTASRAASLSVNSHVANLAKMTRGRASKRVYTVDKNNLIGSVKSLGGSCVSFFITERFVGFPPPPPPKKKIENERLEIVRKLGNPSAAMFSALSG